MRRQRRRHPLMVRLTAWPGRSRRQPTIWGIKRPTVYTYVKTGVLPSLKLGGRLLVPRAAVLALVAKVFGLDGPDVA
jgi:excisionase family DNA binding protein